MQIGPGKHHMCVCVLSCFSHVRLFATPCTAARQAPLFMGFSRQEHWSGLPCAPPGDLPDPRINPAYPAAPTSQVDSLPLSHQGSPRRTTYTRNCVPKNFPHVHLHIRAPVQGWADCTVQHEGVLFCIMEDGSERQITFHRLPFCIK